MIHQVDNWAEPPYPPRRDISHEEAEQILLACRGVDPGPEPRRRHDDEREIDRGMAAGFVVVALTASASGFVAGWLARALWPAGWWPL